MVIAKLSEWLTPDDEENNTHAAKITPQVGAAGLLVVAAHHDESYTDVERDMASAALMKLFHIPNPEAKVMRGQAEEFLFAGERSFVFFAAAAKQLDREDQETLMTQLWRLEGAGGNEASESPLMASVRDFLGFTEAQADALKPAAS